MGHVVETATKAAYQQELRRKHRKVSVSRLPFIHMQPRQEIRPISRRTARALQQAGYETLEDLGWCSSGRLRKVPGISACDMFDIELNLMSMGFSLMIPPVPPWNESLG